MKYMKTETRNKLRNISKKAYEKYGVDIINWSNNNILYYNIGKKTGNYLTRTTMNKWIDYVDERVKNIHNEFLKEQKKDKHIYNELKAASVKTEIKKIENKEYLSNDVKRLVIFFDKEYVEFDCINDMLSFIDENIRLKSDNEYDEDIKPKYKDKYTGLFHYSKGEVMINQHTYSGCKVIKNGKFNEDEINKNFNKVDFLPSTEQFKNWMIHQLNYYFSGKLDSYHKNGIRDIEDTQKDVNFMKFMLKKLWNYEYEYKK